jgi:catechol 2,3-dioxygenase-like lactoylglutathione lyase family enzyme
MTIPPTKNRTLNLLVLLAAVVLANPVSADETELTRFGPEAFAPTANGDNRQETTFFAVPGAGTLVLQMESGGNLADAAITLNDRPVWNSKSTDRGSADVEVPVQLLASNAIRVDLNSDSPGRLVVRVRQWANVQLNITGRIHFNVNVNDFDRSRDFYRSLGFADSVGDFPETNTPEISKAVGFTEPYRLYAELIYLGKLPPGPMDLTVPTGRFIDLVYWKHPHRTEPPYASLNHLGMARFALTTSNLDADIAYLKSRGTTFLSAPARRSDQSRFVVARDPDGTFIELVEDTNAVAVGDGPTHIANVKHVNVNVSDFERSKAFYQMLGFATSAVLPGSDSQSVANAMGFETPYSIHGEQLTHTLDGSLLELVEWKQPRDSAPPYSLPINHVGLHRMNWATSDIAADVATLKAQGVEFLSEIAPCCTGDTSTFGIVVFADPDGVYNQLMGNLKPGPSIAKQAKETEVKL